MPSLKLRPDTEILGNLLNSEASDVFLDEQFRDLHNALSTPSSKAVDISKLLRPLQLGGCVASVPPLR